MVFVTGRSKRAIEDHFDAADELERLLEADGKQDLLALVQEVAPPDMLCSYVRQPRALGLGHAVLCAAHIVGEQPFAVLLADDLMAGPNGGPSVLAQMVEVFEQRQASVLAVQEVLLEQVRRYGIVAGEPDGERLLRVQGMVEKPAPEEAPSRLGVAGRYVLTPRIFDEIRQLKPGAGGEIQLTDAIAALLTKETVLAYAYEGRRYDCGSKEGFLEATVELALQHPQIGAAFREYLKGLAL